MRVLRLIALLLLPLVSACESDPLAVAAHNVEIVLSHGAADMRTLEFEVRNRGWRTVHVAACDGRMVAAVQPRSLWNVQSANEFGVFCLGNVSAIPVAVEPGGSARGQAQAPGAGEFRVALVLQDGESAEGQRVVFSNGLVIP